MNYWTWIVCAFVVLSLGGGSSAFQHAIIDDRMDKVVTKFANFKDIVNLNLFLYELLGMMSDVWPSYGTVSYYHNIPHPLIEEPTEIPTGPSR